MPWLHALNGLDLCSCQRTTAAWTTRATSSLLNWIQASGKIQRITLKNEMSRRLLQFTIPQRLKPTEKIMNSHAWLWWFFDISDTYCAFFMVHSIEILQKYFGFFFSMRQLHILNRKVKQSPKYVLSNSDYCFKDAHNTFKIRSTLSLHSTTKST